eukprot:scaffold628_cov91-Cylindrotheca_fusiformis.AAC.7
MIGASSCPRCVVGDADSTPNKASEWPARYFVPECMDTSAPNWNSIRRKRTVNDSVLSYWGKIHSAIRTSSGRIITGDTKVTSTTVVILGRCGLNGSTALQMASMSKILHSGLDGVSIHTTTSFVLGIVSMAAEMLDAFVMSTRSTLTLLCRTNTLCNTVGTPWYTSSGTRTVIGPLWARIRAVTAIIPEENAKEAVGVVILSSDAG